MSRRAQLLAINGVSTKAANTFLRMFVRAAWNQMAFRLEEFARNPLRTLKAIKQAAQPETRFDRFMKWPVRLVCLAVILLAAFIFTVDMVVYGASARVSAQDTGLKMLDLAKYIGATILLGLLELVQWIRGGG